MLNTYLMEFYNLDPTKQEDDGKDYTKILWIKMEDEVCKGDGSSDVSAN
jgi:hypothetical protein